MSLDYRSQSRRDWTAGAGGLSVDDLKFGCLQRIADATEVMSKGHRQLLDDRDRFERWFNEAQARCERQEKSIRALRGVITRLKRQAAKGGAA